jgi:two-component system capsular synthesis response regulator RcsB
VDIVSEGKALLKLIRTSPADAIIMDIRLAPDLDCFDVLDELRKRHQQTKLVVLTARTQATLVRRVLCAGAHGYVLKHSKSAELIYALRHVLDKKIRYVSPMLRAGTGTIDSVSYYQLTEDQRDLLTLLAKGMRIPEVAAELGLSVPTVDGRKIVLLKRFGARTTLDLVRRVEALGLMF